jgi:hypothetical protein
MSSRQDSEFVYLKQLLWEADKRAEQEWRHVENKQHNRKKANKKAEYEQRHAEKADKYTEQKRRYTEDK